MRLSVAEEQRVCEEVSRICPHIRLMRLRVAEEQRVCEEQLCSPNVVGGGEALSMNFRLFHGC